MLTAQYLEFKRCTHCGEEKSFDSYNKQSNCKYGLRPECQSCASKVKKAYAEKNKDLNLGPNSLLKYCPGCKETKQVTDFHKDARTKDGLRGYCKGCHLLHAKDYQALPESRKIRKSWAQRNPKKVMLASARMRAKRKGLECTITIDDFDIPEFCPVLGIKLISGIGKDSRSDASPTLDRIDNNKGYITGNVQVMSFKANRAKTDLIKQELLSLADWIYKIFGNDESIQEII